MNETCVTDAIGNAAEREKRSRILIGLLPAMFLPLIASILYFYLFPQARSAWFIYSGTKVFTIVWPIIAILLIERERPQFGAIDWSRHIRAIPLGIVTGLLIAGIGIGAFLYTGVGAYVLAHAGAIRQKVQDLNLGPYYFAFAAFIALVHSLIEEYYWRWYVFGRLNKILPRAAAILLASLAFAAHHYAVLGVYFSTGGVVFFGSCVAVGGALWCAMLARQRTLVGAWISHMFVDLAIFYIGYRILFG